MFLFVMASLHQLFHPCFSLPHILDDPVLSQLIESLPPLRPCELLDPADDQTLARLIEVLQQRHRIRQTITEQVNRTGTGHSDYRVSEAFVQVLVNWLLRWLFARVGVR